MNADLATAILIILNCLSAIALFLTVFISAIALFLTVREMHRATDATAYKSVYDILQTDDARSARRFVMTTLASRPFDSWTNDEKLIAEKVCTSYDSAAIMARHGLVPPGIVAENWSGSLHDTWLVLSPLVNDYRIQRNNTKLWDDYEWLAAKAEEYRKVPDNQHERSPS